jgi:hypothetical protein
MVGRLLAEMWKAWSAGRQLQQRLCHTPFEKSLPVCNMESRPSPPLVHVRRLRVIPPPTAYGTSALQYCVEGDARMLFQLGRHSHHPWTSATLRRRHKY